MAILVVVSKTPRPVAGSGWRIVITGGIIAPDDITMPGIIMGRIIMTLPPMPPLSTPERTIEVTGC
jgi:hypothetical protein